MYIKNIHKYFGFVVHFDNDNGHLLFPSPVEVFQIEANRVDMFEIINALRNKYIDVKLESDDKISSKYSDFWIYYKYNKVREISRFEIMDLE